MSNNDISNLMSMKYMSTFTIFLVVIPRVAIKVEAFKRFGVLGWGRDTLNPAREIGGYTSREGIS